MKVSVIQSALFWENRTANLAMFEEKIADITDTDLIILPEMFTTGFSMNSAKLAEPMNLHTSKWMLQMAQAKEAVVTGSIIISEKGHFYNRLLWVRPDGRITFYDKKHLFRMGEENNHFSAGTKQLIEEWQGVRFNLSVCYDLRFPVWLRNKNCEYDVLINVANWPDSRADVWRTLLKARALENQSYVIGVNRIGEDGRGLSYAGDSLIVDAKGTIVKDAHQTDGVIDCELDMDALYSFREKFPVHKDADFFKM